MLKEASKKKIYKRLIEGDLFHFLQRKKEKESKMGYDLIVCCDTVPYLGSLDKLFELVGHSLKRGAFLFSFEALEKQRDWELSFNGRFKHGLSYVKKLENNRLNVGMRRETLREEKGKSQWMFFFGKFN